VIAQLSDLSNGESGTIAYLSAPHGADMQKFLSMGIHPGDAISLVRKTPTIVFRCGHSQFAVDRDLASQVYVRRES
jgi:DtxR family Mn-dependent transcriptional regulator